MIPNSRMGSVIGKQGSKIKEIQDASGARLNASEGMLPGSTEVGILPIDHWIQVSYFPASAQRRWRSRRHPHCHILHREHPHRGAGAHAVVH
jgi:hypothetical protein